MKLGNLPKPLPASAYEATRAFARQKYSGIANLVDIVEFGTTNLPGISDVDLIAITKANQPVEMPYMHEIYSGTYAPMHRPFVYSEETFPRLRFIDPWIIHIKPLFNKSDGYSIEDIQTLSEEEHTWLSLRFMLQWSCTLLRLIGESESFGRFLSHLYLGICIVVKYMYRELRRMGITTEDDPHIPFYERIREEWFTLSPEVQQARLTEGLEHLKDSMRRIIRLMQTHLASTTKMRSVPQDINMHSHAKQMLTEYPNSLILDGGARVFVFQKGRTDAEVCIQTLQTPLKKYGGSFTRIIYILPLELGVFYAHYLYGSGPVSQRVQSKMATDLTELPYSPSPVVDQFVTLTDQIVADTRGVTSAKYFFETFGLRQKSSRKPLRQYLSLMLSALTRLLSLSPLAKTFRQKTFRSTLAQ